MFGRKKPGNEPETRIQGGSRSSGAPNPLAQRFPAEDESPTVDLSQKASTAPPQPRKPSISSDTETRILSATEEDDTTSTNRMDDPPAGWLVVLEGPGKGHSLTIGYGRNPIGRSSEQRITLDFGDELISRKDHAIVTYDHKSRKFYVQHGDGPSLTYLGDDPLLTPQELPPKAEIRIGETLLKFLPLCGDDFCWKEND
jgi:hypothetical protein